MKATDPVCGMRIEPARAAASADYLGRRYHFCSKRCQRAFEAEPAKFAGQAPEAAAAHGAHHHHG